MEKKWSNRKKIVFFSVSLAIVLFFIVWSAKFAKSGIDDPSSDNATLHCAIKDYEGCDDDRTVFRAYGTETGTLTNIEDRHILPYDNTGTDNDYNLRLCCDEVSGHDDLIGNSVVRTYNGPGDINKYGAHVEQNDKASSDYTDINFGNADSAVECVNSEQTCDFIDPSYSCAFKLYKETDSHVASCDVAEAPINVCCRQNVNIPGWNIQTGTKDDGTSYPRPVVTLEDNPDPSTLSPAFGNRVVKIESKYNALYAGIRSDVIPLKPSTRYEASVYVYVPADSIITGSWGLDMHAYTASGCSGNNCHHYTSIDSEKKNFDNTIPKNQWVRRSFTFKTDTDAETGAVHLITTPNPATGTVYADGFSLVEIAGNENLDEEIPFVPSDYNYGCCNANECWTGTECVQNYNEDSGRPTHLQNPSPVCLAKDKNEDGETISTSWSLPFLKSHWEETLPADDQHKYCAYDDQCYAAQELQRGCYNNGTLAYTQYCTGNKRAENWESRTRLLLSDILRIHNDRGPGSFTITCDNADCFGNEDLDYCKGYTVTCVYRRPFDNTIIIGMLVNKSEADNAGFDTSDWQTNQQHYLPNQFITRRLGIDFGNVPTGVPVRLRREFDTNKLEYAKATDLRPEFHRIQSMAYNNRTKLILISNKDIDYEGILNRNRRPTLISYLPRLYEFKDGVVSLPGNLLGNGPFDINLAELLDSTKSFGNTFISQTPGKNIQSIIEVQNNDELYIAGFYTLPADVANICNQLESAFRSNSYSLDTWYVPIEIGRWFNCDYSEPQLDFFALLNNHDRPIAEIPTYYNPTKETPDDYTNRKKFQYLFWNSTAAKFRQFDKCAYKADYMAGSVPDPSVDIYRSLEYIPFDNPTTEGCCKNDTCWSGYSCVKAFDEADTSFSIAKLDSKKTAAFYDYSTGSESNYVCRVNATQSYDSYELKYAVWNKAYKKEKWDWTNYGYCLNTTQCWDGNRCMQSGEISQKYYCDGGNWTTTTKIVADFIIKIAKSTYGQDADYTFSCLQDDKIAKERNVAMCTYFSAGNNNVTVGIMANADPLAFLKDIGYADPAANMGDICSSDGDGYECDPIEDYAGPIKKAIIYPTNNIVLISTDADLKATPDAAFSFRSIWNWFLALFGIKQSDSSINTNSEIRLMLSKTKNFDSIFYSQDHRFAPRDNRISYIETIKERHNSSHNYTYINYRNVTADKLCDPLNAIGIAHAATQLGLSKIFNCSQSVESGYLRYDIFIAKQNNLPTPQLIAAANKIDNDLWREQTYRHVNFSLCAIDASYHISNMPSAIKNYISANQSILFSGPTASGCCEASKCWNGNRCVGEGNANLLDYSNVDPKYVFTCTDGQWSPANIKYDWNDNIKTYCAIANQCFVSSDAYNAEKKTEDMDYSSFKAKYLDYYECTTDEFRFYHDRYCLEGRWTTRTGLIAAALLNFTGENAAAISESTLHCDNYTSALNYLDYAAPNSPTGTLARNYLTPAAGRLSATNNFCVLRYKEGEDWKTAVGTSLNPVTDVGTFIAMTIDENLKNECAEESSNSATANQFTECDGGSEKKLWLDNHTQSIIYNKDGMQLTAPTRFDAFLSFLAHPMRSMMEFVASLFAVKSEASPDIFEYNRYYKVQVGDLTVTGAVRHRLGNDKYIVITYANTSIVVCDYIKRYDDTLICEQAYNVTSRDFDLINGLYPSLTSRLRVTQKTQ